MSHVANVSEAAGPSVLLLTGAADRCGAVCDALEEVGMSVSRTDLRSAALVEALEACPSAIFLDARHDVGLAAQLCTSLRAVEGLSAVHVVALTQTGEAGTRLRLYEAGVDDCWTFSQESRQFLNRASELVRPLMLRKAPPVLRCGAVALNQERYTVTYRGRTAQLTVLQLKLLSNFMRNPGAVFSYRQLLDEVWSNPDGDERMVRAAIVRLRRVLGMNAGASDLIKTVRGGGYAFNECSALAGDPDKQPVPFTKP